MPGANFEDREFNVGGPSSLAKELESGKPIPHPFGLSYAF